MLNRSKSQHAVLHVDSLQHVESRLTEHQWFPTLHDDQRDVVSAETLDD